MLLLALLSPKIAGGQAPPYPIIFIHGLNSDDGTWQTTVNHLRDNFGWNDPYFNDQGIFHALLNASDLSTHFSMDVKTQFPNERNDLYNGNIYAINFKNWWDPVTEDLKPRQNRFAVTIDFSQSNESAIAKQGYALGQMIKKVLAATGKSKVILVGHSMGGLAAREYLQRKDATGKPKWWAFPDEPSGHRVAKLVTIGTPHAGSNMTEFGIPIIIDPKSEAARDLSYNYFASGPPNFGINPDHGVYLFGGSESIIPRYNPSIPAAGGYFNIDVDCDGSENSTVWGINSNVIIRADNTQIPLPVDIDYTWIVSDEGVLNGDGAVRLDRQYLDSKGDTLLIHKLHQNETSDYRAIIRGLDEPDESQKAYDLTPGQAVHGFVDRPSGMGPADHDWFRFNVSQAGNFTLSLSNIPTLQNFTTMVVELFSALDLTKPVIDGRNTGGTTQISLITPVLNPGDYFVHLRGVVIDQAWNRPYALLIQSIAGPTQITLSASPSAIKTNGASATLLAELRDAQGNLNPVATNPVTFTITSGATSATLVGPNPVNAVNGIATITLQSTTTPGLVTIQASSPGLSSGTTTVSVYSNPTLVSGAITTNTTWTLANSPYQVTGDIEVRAGVTLMIEPGVTVLFNNGTDLTINGTLVANGVSGQHINFTTSSANPVVGAWGGLRINQPQGALRSNLSYCDFSYGGQGGYGNYDDVFEISGNADPQVSNCTIVNSRRNGIEILGGDYNSDFRLNITGLPLMLLGDLSVGQSAQMTIGPGVHLKFGSGADLYVNGALAVEGTPNSRIIFTSLRDDAVDGDTGNDGPTSGSVGEWGGIYFNDTIDDSQSKLSYCDFKFAGQGGYGNLDTPIRMDARANPTFLALRFTNCRYNGIDIEAEEYATNISLNQTAAPYIIRGDISLQKGAKLTIAPGTLFKLTTGSDFYIHGELNCEGTAGSPIRFTSIRDDSRGGDSGSDGQTEGRPGDWGGIFFSENVQVGSMKFCEFYFGGGGGYGNLGRPVLLDLQANVSFSSLSFINCTSNGIALRDREYNVDTRLRFPGNTPYLQFGDVVIAAGAKLVIEPGCTIKMSGGNDFYINGGLQADGTMAAPIIFTSIADDSILGDSNNDGKSLGVPGQWGGIAFGSTANSSVSSMRNCQFRFGGGGGYGNVGWVLQVSPLVNPSFANLRFNMNRANGIRLADGSYSTNIVLDQTAAPYLLSGDYGIEASGGLTIAPGTLFKCYGGSDIYIRSRLTAVGTATAPIVFTSFRDDRFAGDTNNDGASNGVAGDWGGIVFQSQSVPGASEIAYCEFWYGAGAGYGNSDAALRFENSSQKVHHIKVRQMRWHGVLAEGNASPDLGGGAYLSPGNNSFLDFNTAADRFAVFNDGSATIFAKNNTWDGSTVTAIAQEIYDKTDNASKGEVIFQPFIPAGDTEAPHVSVLFPNGGETLLAGRVATLRWYVRDNVGVTQVSVSLSRDGGQVFQPLTSFTGQQEEYAWTAAGPFSSRCLLKVTARDAAGNERFDVSDNFFAIVDSAAGVNYPPSIPLPLRPLAGEEMRGNDLLIWQASVDPNPFDRIVYRLEIDNNADFFSPELVEDNIDSSRTTAISESAKSGFTFVGQNVLAVRLDRLAGFAKLQDDVTYYWRLRARDQQNAMSAFSSGTARFFMNKINTPPQAVVNGFSPTNNLEVRAARPTISWQAADDPDPSDGAEVLRYRLQLDDDGEFINDVAVSVQTNPGVTFYVPAQDLHENARYSWRVQASDDEGASSPWSAVQSFFVNAIKEPPRPFEILSPPPIFISSSDTVIFRWQTTTDPDPFDSLHYVVEWSTNRSFTPLNKLVPKFTTPYAFVRPSRVDSIFWRLYAVDSDTLSTYASNSKQQPRLIRWQTTVVNSRENALPTEFSLAQNYPNPFNPETTIQFSLPKRSRITIRIFNLVGSEIRTLRDEIMEPGYHQAIWDGKDATGRPVPSGVYLYKMQAGVFVAVKKCVLVH
jgi:pimeloyl-ACP methyl ester carboxylesterase